MVCVTGWILGIGDRHLKNILISLNNGEIIPIDFGFAFGTATQIIQVPELVPFRLTPQFIKLMEPFKTDGFIRETMIHCLRALRKSSSSILAALDVFIQEPSIDWLEFARMLNKTATADENWYPVEKLNQAKRKLTGTNSAIITIEELKAHSKIEPEIIKKFVEYVRGSPDSNRTKYNENLSVTEQVDCLIEHATDYNLLGRMWVGWEPWI